ncbi:MAG: hypothetical protein ABJD66_03295 [Cellulophaga sp.]|uniref:hypothetical protein n=1 Tax=Cellulophaga sp. TaxID=1972202 RepID=UPI0032665D62
MIKSELISTIIELTVESEKFESQLLEQIELLTEKESEHTRVGLYVYLKPENGIEEHRLSKSQLEQMFGEHNHELTKFELINKNENVLADLTVHFSNGIIDCVEIWNKLGDYPKEELLTYELKKI